METSDATCFGENDGEVVVTAEGGTGAFQYSDDGNNYGQGNDFDDLLAGTYTFFAQDENGCVQTVDATIGEPEAIVVTGIVSEGSVTGEGTIDVTVTGGSLPYTYEWIGPGVSGQDGQDLEGISTGSYTVDVPTPTAARPQRRSTSPPTFVSSVRVSPPACSPTHLRVSLLSTFKAGSRALWTTKSSMPKAA